MHGSYGKASLKYGLILGLVLSFVLFLRYLIGFAPDAPVSKAETWTVFAIMLIGGGIATYYYRNNLTDKKITFKEAYLLSLLSNIIACIIYAMFMYIYATSIDNGEDSFLKRSIGVLVKNFTEKGEAVPDMTGYRISFLSISSLMYNMVMSVLAAFISAMIFRNEKAAPYIKEKKK